LNEDLTMKTKKLCWTLAAICAAAPISTAIAAPALGCLIEPDRVADVGSPVVAVIDSMEVDRGQTVRKGQVLVILRADVERAALDAARSRADANADLQAAAANAAFNRERLVRAEDLFRQNFISQQALDQARTESQMADQKLTQAREQQVVSSHERGMAAAQLQQRTIRSPMDGVVAERFMSAGERVDDKPLLRIARIDPLRVQLVVPTSLYGQVQPDAAVSVVPDLPGSAALTARVTMVDKVIDPASNTFRVQLALPNPDHSLPAGLRCKADFGPLAAARNAAATPTQTIGTAAARNVVAPAPTAPTTAAPAQPAPAKPAAPATVAQATTTVAPGSR
jgi:membrane fusion protein, heavy metal efflux system